MAQETATGSPLVPEPSNEGRKEMWYFTHTSLGALILSRTLGFMSTVALLGTGVYLHSFLMQLVGFVFFCIAVAASYANARRDRYTFASPQALADELKRRFGVTAQ